MNNIELYKANEILENKYYQIPQELFYNDLYKDKLNSDSKILYAFLLDRLTLSIKNNWVNEKGEVYLIFTRQEVQEKLNLSDKTVSKAFKQLTETNLVFEKRQGLGKPNIIFIGKIQHESVDVSTDTEILRFKKRKNYDSRVVEDTIQDTENVRPINTNNNYTNISRLNLISSNLGRDFFIDEDEMDYGEIFKRNIEFDNLVQDKNQKELIENIVSVAIEAINSRKDSIYINSEPKKQEIVKNQLLKLNPGHIQYVINSIKKNINTIKNIRSYIITSLYNAVNTIDIDATLEASRIMNTWEEGNPC